jgi:rare lipoprotein A
MKILTFALVLSSIINLTAQAETASHYGNGPGEGGPLTANREQYNPNAMTAAHKTLPFGTKLKVTNCRTGKSIIVRINDRGPFISGRDIDLSSGAAKAIGLNGVGCVQTKVVR